MLKQEDNEAALRRGDYKPVTASSSSVFSFLRQYGNQSIFVVSNTGGSVASGVLLSLNQTGIAPGNYTLIELQGGSPISLEIDSEGNFTNLSINQIPARSTLIYKLQGSTITNAEKPLSNSITVYPVPANNEIFISFPHSYTGTIQYRITDLLGDERVTSSFFSTDKFGQYRLLCDGLSSGVYFLTLEYNGMSEVVRIVIQK